MTLSVFFVVVVSNNCTPVTTLVWTNTTRLLSFKGTRCKKAGAILVFELLSHNWVTFLVL